MKTYDKTKGKSALYLLVFLLACIIYYQQEKLYENNTQIYSIEHIQNVDEMQTTPDELYLFTNKGKYKFDGQKVEFISTYK
tara:strand:+ start:333 stop:575 length:243 start_codon:yes stop_codon:yes gene_type:complete